MREHWLEVADSGTSASLLATGEAGRQMMAIQLQIMFVLLFAQCGLS